MKDAYYFSHDSNARHDPKIAAALYVYDKAYQWYFMLIEMMREQSDHKLRINSKHSLSVYAHELRCTEEEIRQFIQDCIRPEKDDGFALFKSDGEYFWSESLLRRMALREDKIEKAKKAAQKRWGSKKEEGVDDADAMQTQCERNADEQCEGNGILKEIKEKKEKIYGQNFDQFWVIYPRKVKKKDAYKIWSKLKPDEKLVEEIMEGLKRHINSTEWQKNNGEFIPHPTTFLNQERWMDEVTERGPPCTGW